MTTLRGGARQAAARHKGVVQGIPHQCRQTHIAQTGLGGGTSPIVVGVLEAVQRCGEHVVKRVQGPGAAGQLQIKQTGKLAPLGFRLAHHGAQKHARVHPAVEALVDGGTRRGQIQRCRHRSQGTHFLRGLHALFRRPTQERVTAQRNSDGQHRSVWMQGPETAQHPVDFLVVPRVVSPGRPVDFPRTPPEMRHGKTPTALLGHTGKRLHVMAV
jgi:hypothetical protein